MPLASNRLVPNFRLLTADDLGIGVVATAAGGAHGSSSPDSPILPHNHPMVQLVTRLAREYGGVIFTGPPGTSKTFFAAELSRLFTDDDKTRQWSVQFHPSYQYEEFMLGVAPSEVPGQGFVWKAGPFVTACRDAASHRDKTYVIVIDELSRADVGRVFGEALTYVERSKRELEFTIAAGYKIRVPSNLVILATMNQFDRGVDDVDAAFERRFAKITLDPNREFLSDILADNEVDDRLRVRVIGWFDKINSLARDNPAAAVGHTYFMDVKDEDSLRDLWNFQLRYLVERAFRRDKTTRMEIEAAWERIFNVPTTPAPGDGNEQG